MLCNEYSVYPDKIDEMTFFQDVSLNTIEYMNQYQNLISKEKYTDADNYINDQTGIYGYFACFFNMLENRIFALQNYLSNDVSGHEGLSGYFHDELGDYTHDEISLLANGNIKLNPINNQYEMPEHAISGFTIWTGGKHKNEEA